MNCALVLENVWAKAPREGQMGESLLAHTEMVIRALADIARLRPHLHEAIGSPRLWHWAFWGCCLHDLGKSARGFQQQLRTGGLWGHRHEVLSLAFLDWLQPDDEDRSWIAAAIASHHKDVGLVQERYPNDMQADDLILNSLVAEVPDEVIESLAVNFYTKAERWCNELGFISLGVKPLDFEGKNAEFFRRHATASICYNLGFFYHLARKLAQRQVAEGEIIVSLVLRGLVILADHMASSHAQAPLLTLQGVNDLMNRLGLEWDNLYEHQRGCAVARTSAILTAPTGSGKTESALFWVAKQIEHATGVGRIFYVLPFQASMNAMHQRLSSFFPGEVGLEHARSLYALYRLYLQTEDTPEEAARLAKLARNLSALHAYPIKVLSPYQLLKAFYRLRGYEAILTDCFNGLFIFDEIHAYEPERIAMILGMIRFLRERFQAKFCVMTATMPPPILAHVQQALWMNVNVKASDDLAMNFCRHRLQLLDGEIVDDANLKRIVRMASNGQSVLVCCNTVRRAQEVYSALKLLLPGVHVNMLHSRFTGRDRLNKERVWLKDASKPSRPVGVLVATQVVEVSLNLDFDTIFTEPAPLEALLQRFGRVNRLGLKGLVTVHVFRQPNDGQHVYDLCMLQRTLRVLASANEKKIDELQIADWLAEIYQGEILEGWLKRFAAASREFNAACLKTLHAFDSDEKFEDAFYKAFDNIEVLPLSLELEYGTAMESDPIRASEFLVSISWRQYARLKRERRIRTSVDPKRPPIVDAPYSFEMGLALAESLPA